MTNSLSSIYTAITGGYTSAFDGLMGIAVSILAVSVGFALVSGMFKKRAKVK